MTDTRRITFGAVLVSLALSLAVVRPAAAALMMSKPDHFAPYLTINTQCSPGTVTTADVPMCTTHRTVVSNAIPHYADTIGDTAKTNILALQSYVSNCSSSNLGIKGMCLQVSALMKLFQEDTDMLVKLSTATETISGTDDSGNPYSYQDLSKANVIAWRNAVRTLEAMMFNDGVLLQYADFFPTQAYDLTLKTVPSTDARFQAAYAADDAVKAAGKSFESAAVPPCFSAYQLIFTAGQKDDVDKDTAPEMRTAMIACNQAVLAAGSAYLESINAYDKAMTGGSGAAGPVAGGQGVGSVLTLPLPFADISLPALIARVIRQLLSVVGALALLFFVWGGVRWMLARGVPEEVAKAKKTIVAAVSGLIAIFASYAILSFIIKAVS